MEAPDLTITDAGGVEVDPVREQAQEDRPQVGTFEERGAHVAEPLPDRGLGLVDERAQLGGRPADGVDLRFQRARPCPADAQLRHELRHVVGERDRLGQAALLGLHVAKLLLQLGDVGLAAR
ncbi:MAG: hypothetical protein HS111_27375 [Kofleriaceae bacterium]|nr:hypothetical protein [Kofleriaceae bacterium]